MIMFITYVVTRTDNCTFKHFQTCFSIVVFYMLSGQRLNKHIKSIVYSVDTPQEWQNISLGIFQRKYQIRNQKKEDYWIVRSPQRTFFGNLSFDFIKSEMFLHLDQGPNVVITYWLDIIWRDTDLYEIWGLRARNAHRSKHIWRRFPGAPWPPWSCR